MTDRTHGQEEAERRRLYWRANIKLLSTLFAIWALVSLGAGVVFADALNTIVISGAPLGFWFAQQGSILTFIVLIFVYSASMKRLDAKYGLSNPAGEEDA